MKRKEENLRNRIKTGIPGLDELIEGGLIPSSTVLLKGQCGTGKTIFGLQYLIYGALHSEPGVFLSIEESKNDLVRESAKFGWDLETFVKQGKLAIIERQTQYSLTINELEKAAKQLKAKRAVIDSVPALFSSYPNELRPSELRSAFYVLCQLLTSSCGCASILITEEGWSKHASYEEYVPKGVLELQLRFIEGVARKFLLIKKMREVRHSRRMHLYEITNSGFTIFTPREPKMEES
ncbi:MAG: RAD55 family ATPase [Candidatus Bathycorpusculaceae bacterium]